MYNIITYITKITTNTKIIRITHTNMPRKPNTLKGGFEIIDPRYHDYIKSKLCHMCKTKVATHRTRLKYYECKYIKCFNVLHPTCKKCKDNINTDKW